MIKWYRGLGLIFVVVALAGCASGAATPAPAVSGGDTYASATLKVDFTNALTVRNQLALGLLNLEGTANEVTPAQAKSLLPLWQALRGTARSGAAATAEVDALLSQIEETLTPGQLEAISALRLTQDDLRAWAESQGITVGTGAGVGAGAGGGMGAGRGLSPEERATRQAENGGDSGNSGGLSTALLDAVVTFLEVRL
ncbi:MAG: hypothetical protein ACP5J4_16950 [Anaerolineae bacterium]